MTPQRYERIWRIVHALADERPEGRERLLERECGDDADLRREVEAFLEQPELDTGQLRTPVAHAAQEAWSWSGQPPERIGSFRIIRKLGQGGMGEVFLAEQDVPKRIVALKVVRRGPLSAGSRRQFEYEAHVLGRLRHPGIAQIFEAGTFDAQSEGIGYFAMEHIEGLPLTEYAARHQLSKDKRLELLARVCDAVQHAHQKGVVHRDLKPANILVEDAGQPKVLDFGVALVTDSDLQITTQHTAVGQILGTVAYMSPEQVNAAADIDTRSDVYALGVVGYELLSGHLPYDVRDKTIAQAARLISEADPRPLGLWRRELNGDVDTILRKSLEKDRERRYNSAGDLAADIRRCRNHESISARPASTIDQLRRFALRNTRLVAALAALFVVLVAGSIVSTLLAIRARNAQRLADAQAVEANLARATAEAETARFAAINDFLNEDLLASAAPGRHGADVSMRQVLDAAAARVAGRFEGEPLVEAGVRDTLGTAYGHLGEYAAAEEHLSRALALYEQAQGHAAERTLASMGKLAWVIEGQGRFDEAERLKLNTAEGCLRALGPEHASTLRARANLAHLYQNTGRLREAESVYIELLEPLQRRLSADHAQALTVLSNLGSLYLQQGRIDEAQPLLTQAADGRRRVLGNEHPDTLATLTNLGILYVRQARFTEAESTYEEVLEIRRRVLGPKHPSTVISLTNLAALYYRTDRLDQAESLFVEALDLRREVSGADHPETIAVAANLGMVHYKRGDFEQAAVVLEGAAESARRALPETHLQRGIATGNYGKALTRLQRFDEAERALLEAQGVFESTVGSSHAYSRVNAKELADLYDAWNRTEEAAAWRRRADGQPVP